jgi:hypothetical protein
MRNLARRVVWAIGEEGVPTAMVGPKGFVDAAGVPVAVPEGAMLRLMHPALLDAAALGAWRARLVERRLVQPFKQAFREVLRPTAAELAGGSEPTSVRFEGVVARLRPFAALLRARGWAGLGGVGPGGWVARRELPGHGLAVGLTVRPAGAQRAAARRHVTIGRVGFVEPGEGAIARSRPLGRVPAAAYAEAMRDVALAAAAASVAAEPGSEAARRRGAALADVARARAELVSALLPQLGLAAVVEVAGEAAIVDCAGHRFRLDLGTGDVTLGPDDRPVDLDGLERGDLPLYIPHEGADAPSAAVLATLVWLAKFGRACAERDPR